MSTKDKDTPYREADVTYLKTRIIELGKRIKELLEENAQLFDKQKRTPWVGRVLDKWGDALLKSLLVFMATAFGAVAVLVTTTAAIGMHIANYTDQKHIEAATRHCEAIEAEYLDFSDDGSVAICGRDGKLLTIRSKEGGERYIRTWNEDEREQE